MCVIQPLHQECLQLPSDTNSISYNIIKEQTKKTSCYNIFTETQFVHPSHRLCKKVKLILTVYGNNFISKLTYFESRIYLAIVIDTELKSFGCRTTLC